MKLSYAVINFDKNLGKNTIDRLLSICPFSYFFDKKWAKRVELDLGEAPIEPSWPLNIEDIASKNKLTSIDTTEKFGERRVIFTNNPIFYCDMFPSPLLYGAAIPHYGQAFVRPVTPHDLKKKITAPDNSYVLELAAHELGGTLVYSPGEWEECDDKTCFAFGKGEHKGEIIHPPRGRNHFCKQHQTYMINRFTHQGRFFSQELERYCKDNTINI